MLETAERLLSEADEAYLARARSAFIPTNGSLLPTEKGTILVCCGDDTRAHDITVRLKLEQERMFEIKLPGVPLRLNPNFPGCKGILSPVLIDFVREALRLREYQYSLSLVFHWPCQVALNQFVSAKESLQYARQTCELMRGILEPHEVRLHSFLDIKWSTDKARTYHVNFLDDSVASHLGIY